MELTLEQQLKYRVFQDKVLTLSIEDARKLLLIMYEQSLIKDNFIKLQASKYLGVDDDD